MPRTFQSTCLREARRASRCCRSPSAPFQSTCLREARLSPGKMRCARSDFNPRACVRHDALARVWGDYAVFQSTCLREARLGDDDRLAVARPISIHVPA